MSSNESPSTARPLLVRIFAALIPSACLIVVLATLSAVLAAYGRTGGAAGSSRAFWVTLAFAAAAEMLALAVAAYATVRLARGIARPISRMAGEALAATERGAAGRLSEHGGVAELRDLARAFNRLLDEQERRIEEIGCLGANLLHDIKTPISTMKNASVAALSGDCGAEEALAAISENCDTLLLAVANDHDISALVSGLGREHRQPVDLVAEVARALQIHGFTADAKRQTVAADLPSGQVFVSAHRLRIQQLIGNLVDNAVKYTPEGGRISVSLSADAQTATLAVSDTGIGMSPAEREKIFLRYFRADASRREPGFGLGLPLVKAIVDFYHGAIGVESSPGGGSTFTVSLPLPAAQTTTCRGRA